MSGAAAAVTRRDSTLLLLLLLLLPTTQSETFRNGCPSITALSCLHPQTQSEDFSPHRIQRRVNDAVVCWHIVALALSALLSLAHFPKRGANKARMKTIIFLLNEWLHIRIQSSLDFCPMWAFNESPALASRSSVVKVKPCWLNVGRDDKSCCECNFNKEVRHILLLFEFPRCDWKRKRRKIGLNFLEWREFDDKPNPWVILISPYCFCFSFEGRKYQRAQAETEIRRTWVESCVCAFISKQPEK